MKKDFECIIFDWAGTTVDYGCFAPVQAFVEVFRHYGIEPTMEEVSTSLSASEILQMAVGVFDYTLGDSKGFPFDSATPESVPGYSGSYVVPVGLENNVIQLHEFLFPDEEYTPTEKLTSISDNIAYITGIYPEVTSDSTTQESGSESTEDNGYGY